MQGFTTKGIYSHGCRYNATHSHAFCFILQT